MRVAGRAAFKRGDYKTALTLYTKAATKGDAEAQTNLGIMYREGIGVKQNYDQAALWFRKAADQGNSLAQFMLGQMYGSGEGVPQDYGQALLWYRKAAEQGDVSFLAQSNLGLLYEQGRGVAQDYNQAAIWYRKAAEQGWPWAQIKLGSMYADGRGVSQDWVEAHKWYNLAAADSSLDKEQRDIAIKGRDNAAEKIKQAQIQSQQSQKPNPKACIEGPQALRQIDGWEQAGRVADIKRFGFPITPEQLAESYIADCSY